MPSKRPFSYWLRNTWFTLRNLILFTLALLVLTSSTVPVGDLSSQVHAYTHPIEFDFITWTLEAIGLKLSEWGFGLTQFMDQEAQSDLVRLYIQQLQTVQALNNDLTLIYSDPAIADPDSAGQSLREELAQGAEEIGFPRPTGRGDPPISIDGRYFRVWPECAGTGAAPIAFPGHCHPLLTHHLTADSGRPGIGYFSPTRDDR